MFEEEEEEEEEEEKEKEEETAISSQTTAEFKIPFVCFDHRLFTPASTPNGVDFCVHGRLCSRLKGSCAPNSERCMLGIYL